MTMASRYARLLIAMLVCGTAGAEPLLVPADSAVRLTGIAGISSANDVAVARLTRVFSCIVRVWPNWPVNSLHVLLVDVPRQNAVLLHGATAPPQAEGAKPNVTTILYEAVPAQLKDLKPGFTIIRWPDLGQILAVFHSAATDAEIDRVVEIALHEGFHLSGQRMFARYLATPTFSGAHYPEDVRVRYLRYEIMRTVSRIHRGDPLGPIASWENDLGAKRGDRNMRQSDRIEGSAEYVAMLGLSIAKHGCTAPDEILYGDARVYAEQRSSRRLVNYLVRPNAITEAYVIGAHAGLLLQRSGRNGWHEAVEKGATFLDLLLENVLPATQNEDRELFNRLETIIAPRNAMIKGRLEGLNNALQSPLHAVASFPSLRIGPNVATLGLLTYDADDKKRVQVALDLLASPLLGDDGGSLALKGTDIRFETSTPCGPARQVIFPVKREGVRQLGGGRVNISDEGIVGTNVRVMAHDRNGVQWLCIRAD